MKTEIPTIRPSKNPQDMIPGEVLISKETINERLQQISSEIASQLQDKNAIVIGLLQGAQMITDELEKCLKTRGTTIEKKYITARSYEGTKSSGVIEILGGEEIDVINRDVLLIDDVCDTGLTLSKVKQFLLEKRARSVNIFVLVCKEGTQKVEISPDFTCFNIPNIWIQGHGMDTDGQGRENPDVIIGPYYEEQAVLA
jgi:hypoxanthine phosphoribosyltransferase